MKYNHHIHRKLQFTTLSYGPEHKTHTCPTAWLLSSIYWPNITAYVSQKKKSIIVTFIYHVTAICALAISMPLRWNIQINRCAAIVEVCQSICPNMNLFPSTVLPETVYIDDDNDSDDNDDDAARLRKFHLPKSAQILFPATFAFNVTPKVCIYFSTNLHYIGDENFRSLLPLCDRADPLRDKDADDVLLLSLPLLLPLLLLLAVSSAADLRSLSFFFKLSSRDCACSLPTFCAAAVATMSIIA